MFCVECGTKLPEGAKFCPQCGFSIKENDSVENKSLIDTSKIIREDTFRLNGAGLIHEKGILKLYTNRLEWNGSSSFTINISDIMQVSVKDSFGAGFLIIKTNDKITKFAMTNSTTTALAMLGNIALAAMADKKISDLEYWRMEIENLRNKVC